MQDGVTVATEPNDVEPVFCLIPEMMMTLNCSDACTSRLTAARTICRARDSSSPDLGIEHVLSLGLLALSASLPLFSVFAEVLAQLFSVCVSVGSHSLSRVLNISYSPPRRRVGMAFPRALLRFDNLCSISSVVLAKVCVAVRLGSHARSTITPVYL